MVIETPKLTTTGNDRSDIEEMKKYLFRLSENLNVMLDGVDRAIVTVQRAQGEAADKAEKLSSGVDGVKMSYADLKSLIIKTADEVYYEMDRVVTELNGKFVAVSDFGIYKEEVERRIDQNATGTTDYYNFKEEITPKVEGLKTTTEDLKTGLETTQEDFNFTKNDLANTKTDLSNTKTELASTKEGLEATAQKTSALESDLEATSTELGATKTDLTNTKAEVKNNQEAIQTAGDRVNSVEDTINNQQGALNTLSEKTNKNEEDVKKANSAAEANKKSIEDETKAREEQHAETEGKLKELENEIAEANNALAVYKVDSQQYTRSGLLFFEKVIKNGIEVEVPRFGFAVGENFTTITATDPETGEEVVVLDRRNLFSAFTSDKLSFFMQGNEVAYISNNKLSVQEAEVFGHRLKVGKWLVNTENDYWNLEWEG